MRSRISDTRDIVDVSNSCAGFVERPLSPRAKDELDDGLEPCAASIVPAVNLASINSGVQSTISVNGRKG